MCGLLESAWRLSDLSLRGIYAEIKKGMTVVIPEGEEAWEPPYRNEVSRAGYFCGFFCGCCSFFTLLGKLSLEKI